MSNEEFERVVLAQKDRLYAYATLIVRDSGDAQDVTQDAFVRLWEHRKGVVPRSAGAWLTKTVRNLGIDRLRRRRTRPEAGTEVEPRDEAAVGPERRTHSRELGRSIARALRGLSELDRSVIVLREVQGLTYAEIATILALPLGTLKARLHRAREQLRVKLARVGVTP